MNKQEIEARAEQQQLRRIAARRAKEFRDNLANAALSEDAHNTLPDIAAETFAPLDQIAPLLKERGSTHGDWKTQATFAQNIKTVLGLDTNPSLRPDEREALEMISVKLSRILTGDAHFEDHWRDIAGYATLAADLNKAA